MKNFLAVLMMGLALIVAEQATAQDAKEVDKTQNQYPENPLQPLGDGLDRVGRTAVFGIGAIIAAPLRFVQDVINGVSQGAAGEKASDHTN